MAIRKRGKNWGIDIRINGQRIRQIVGPSKKEALLYESKLKIQALEGKFFDKRLSQSKPLSFLLEEFLKRCEDGTHKIKSSTLDRYRLCQKNLLAHFGSTLMADIKPVRLQEYIEARKATGKSNATINRELAFLKVCFSMAEKWEWAHSNPAKKIDMLKEPKGRVRYLSPDERDQLLNALPWYVCPIVLFAMYTGMRKEEILSLEWKQVSIKDRTILLTDTKNDEKRSVPLCDTAIEVLKDVGQVRRIDIPYVFFNPLSDNRWKDINKTFRKACSQAGIKDFKFHDLRHTAASYLVMSGVSINVVREILGHSTMDMTLRYAHLAETFKVQEVRKLDGAFERAQQKENYQALVTNWSHVGKTKDYLDYAATLNPSTTAEKMAGETGLEPATAGFGIPFSEKYRELLEGTDEYSEQRKRHLAAAKKKKSLPNTRNQKKSTSEKL